MTPVPVGERITDLNDQVAVLFEDKAQAVLLSSIHKAKGKEAARVSILFPELLPAPFAWTEEELRAEACVRFVALTRATADLTFVERDEVSPTAWWRATEPLPGTPLPSVRRKRRVRGRLRMGPIR